MPDIAELRSTAQRWKEAEPDADMRDELQALLDGSDDVLVDRFTGRLQFGTAGLRAAVGAGPQRMNRLVVQQAAAGLVDYLLAHVPGSAEAGVTASGAVGAGCAGFGSAACLRRTGTCTSLHLLRCGTCGPL